MYNNGLLNEVEVRVTATLSGRACVISDWFWNLITVASRSQGDKHP